MKKLIAVLIVLAVIAAGLFGYLLYNAGHIFVEDAVYAKNAQQLDLRGTGISLAHYETVHAQLPDCEIIWDVPIQDSHVASNATELRLNGLTENDFKMIRYFSDLKTLEVSNCQQYTALEKLQSMVPNAQVKYVVDLGGSGAEPTATELTLKPGSYDYAVLVENLQYLPELRKITFSQTELDAQQFEELKNRYEAVTFDYTVDLMGTELNAASTEVDLSAMTPEDLEDVLAKLPLLAGLETIKLAPGTSENGLTLEQVAKMKQAAPGIRYEYEFELFGESFTTNDEAMYFKNKRKEIKDDTLPQLRHALEIMNNCTKVTLDNTAATNAACAQLREDYRGKTEVVWRIYFADYGTCLTDVEVLRVVYDLYDDNCQSLQYLEKVRYMDIGHNEFLDACDFVAGMPELEVAIISGAPIVSLEPFKNCTKLKFLEMSNCAYIPDLEPLRGCTELEMLNIGHTQISDLSPLDDLKLTHLTTKKNKVSEEERLRFEELHPECWTTYQGDNDYSTGWRYDEKGDKLEWYAKLAEAFHYPHPENKTGWYLK